MKNDFNIIPNKQYCRNPIIRIDIRTNDLGFYGGTAKIDFLGLCNIGFSDIWASVQDISFWDIVLAGSILIHKQGNRVVVYTLWQLPDGTEMPAVAEWQFNKCWDLMDIKGSVPDYSSSLSRFTHLQELVCMTLLANKEGWILLIWDGVSWEFLRICFQHVMIATGSFLL